MALMIIAGLIIVLLLFLFLFVAVDLAVLPGKIARRRGHPQADSVRIAGIIGLFTGVLWPLALAWAYYRQPADAPSGSANPGPSEQEAQLKARIAELETKVAAYEADAGGATP